MNNNVQKIGFSLSLSSGEDARQRGGTKAAEKTGDWMEFFPAAVTGNSLFLSFSEFSPGKYLTAFTHGDYMTSR